MCVCVCVCVSYLVAQHEVVFAYFLHGEAFLTELVADEVDGSVRSIGYQLDILILLLLG